MPFRLRVELDRGDRDGVKIGTQLLGAHLLPPRLFRQFVDVTAVEQDLQLGPLRRRGLGRPQVLAVEFGLDAAQPLKRADPTGVAGVFQRPDEESDAQRRDQQARWRQPHPGGEENDRCGDQQGPLALLGLTRGGGLCALHAVFQTGVDPRLDLRQGAR